MDKSLFLVKFWRSVWLAVSLVSFGAPLWAAGPLLSLDAQARSRVSFDVMTVRFAYERDGADLAPLNQQVLNELNSLITEGQAAASVKASLGGIYTQQNFTPQGRPNGWKVRGEVVLESRQFKTLGELAGQLSKRAQISSVSFGLSPEKTALEEARLLPEAAALIKRKAEEAAKAFGFSGFEYRELSLGRAGNFPIAPRQQMMMRSKGMAEAAMPTEGGEGEVFVQIHALVELKAAAAK
jgi:predicted secreted protein